MAEAGSFADRVKQQADIVRVVGEYVRLKKSGQNFTGLCPFHAEKSPAFAVHPTKQIYHCFGCGVGGDVFKFVMEMEKCAFPEAIRIVAEKCGIAVPRQKERSPEERKENQQRALLVEMHREAQSFFVKQDRKSTRLNSSHGYISYAVFCLKKKHNLSKSLPAPGNPPHSFADAPSAWTVSQSA